MVYLVESVSFCSFFDGMFVESGCFQTIEISLCKDK